MVAFPVTGTLTDYQLNARSGLHPRINFKPSGPGLAAQRVFFSRDNYCTPDSNGDFEIQLQRTDSVSPEVWYDMFVDWLDPEGNFTGADYVGIQIRVVPPGGTVSELARVKHPAGIGYRGLTAPADPHDGLMWLHDDPENPGTGTGQIRRWDAVAGQWQLYGTWRGPQGVQGIRGPQGVNATPADGSIVPSIVYHGANAAYLRPELNMPIWWNGSVSPANMMPGDSWFETEIVSVVPVMNLVHGYGAKTFGLANGAAIASWADRVGSANAVQATPANRPTFAKVESEWGSAVRFERASGQFLKSSPAAVSQPGMIFAVVKSSTVTTSSAGANERRLVTGLDGTNAWSIGQLGDGTSARWRLSVGTTSIFHTGAVANTGWTVLVAAFDGNESFLRVNGVQQTMALPTAGTSGFCIGTPYTAVDRFFDGLVERIDVSPTVPANWPAYEQYLIDLVSTFGS